MIADNDYMFTDVLKYSVYFLKTIILLCSLPVCLVFGWVGYLIACCCMLTIAASSGAAAGFGLSLIKTAILWEVSLNVILWAGFIVMYTLDCCSKH